MVVSTLYQFPVLKLNRVQTRLKLVITAEWVSSGDVYGLEVQCVRAVMCSEVLYYISFCYSWLFRDYLSGCHNKIVATYYRQLIIYSLFLSSFFLELTQKMGKTIRKCTSTTMRYPICIASTLIFCSDAVCMPRHCCLIYITSKWQQVIVFFIFQ